MIIAADVVAQTVEALQSIAELGGKVFPVLTEEELDKLCDYVPFPGVGVVYEGITSKVTDAKSPGIAAGKLHLALVVFYKVDTTLGAEAGTIYQQKAVVLLDEIRKKMFDLKASNMRPFEFQSENNPLQSGSMTMWIQRWTLPVVLQ